MSSLHFKIFLSEYDIHSEKKYCHYGIKANRSFNNLIKTGKLSVKLKNPLSAYSAVISLGI